MRLVRSQIIFIAIAAVILLLAVLLFAGIIPGLRSTGPQAPSGTLTIWGVDAQQLINETLIADYQNLYPDVKIEYREMNEATYEADLINALAAGKGPDIFMIKNTWLPKHYDKVAPLGAQTYPVSLLEKDFPEVVRDDFTKNGATYALPLYIDTLTTFYNRDIFNNAGIAEVPATWEGMNTILPQLRQTDRSGTIVRAAMAIGGSDKSIKNAPDLLALLMLQEQVPMVSNDLTRATFDQQGVKTLRRYTNYANPANNAYTWNDDLRYSPDAFAGETTAMYFDYSAAAINLQEKNPFLNFSIAPMPQTQNAKAINYPSYWGLTVANTSRNIGLAWNFIGGVTLDADIATHYSDSSNRPPALRTLLSRLASNPARGFLAKQALTAKSWYQINPTLITTTFSQMIEKVLKGQNSAEDAIKQSAEAITTAMQQANARNF